MHAAQGELRPFVPLFFTNLARIARLSAPVLLDVGQEIRGVVG